MKKIIISLTLVLFAMKSHSAAINTDPTPKLKNGYYVTIGVYAQSKISMALSFKQSIEKMGYEADLGLSTRRNYLYVYVLYTENFKEALSKMRAMRKEESFEKTWVYVHQSEMKPSANVTKEIVEKDETPQEEQAQMRPETKVDKTEVVDTKSESENTDEPEEVGEEVTEEIVEDKEEGENAEGLQVYFNVVNARNRKPIEGEVQVIDVERAKLFEAVDAGAERSISDPNNGTGELELIMDNFGFRKNQLSFNYYNPDTTLSYITKVDDQYLIDVEMIRYHKGDIATMYNVYFFKDASIMRPESKFELNSLLSMMEENPEYVIKIHGHTNGNSAGKIISKDDSDDFFALAEGNSEGFGSAKKLSKERAEIVRDFLISKGISSKRLDVKGWGGKRMVHEKIGNRARHNVRVEIEILEE